MRDWNLGIGDPLALSLSADFRLSTPDYLNDQIWELEIGGGAPPALALHTTYGLRARSMRIFPRFSVGTQMITDPATFPSPPRLRRFHPNFLQIDFSPYSGLDIVTEYWVPDSHTAAGRFTITNHAAETLSLLVEMCGQLAPLEGQSLAPLSLHSVNILTGRTSSLVPVIFLTGGPQPGPGPYPSLMLDLSLPAGSSRSFTWVQAALASLSASFELARRTAARSWEAEYARIERIDTAQTIEILSGDPDWDAAFAFSQKTAFSLFFGPSQFLPYPSFVIARQQDNGHSPRGDGSDYSPLWSGQSPLEAGYIASLLPGAQKLAAGLIRNFMSAQNTEGAVDWRPGLAGQHGKWLAAPLLASLAWQTYRRTLDINFLHEIQSGLHAFIECWFSVLHDRDLDGFPEWDHPLQTGLEDNPAYTVWQVGGQGARIFAAESPALSAMLAHEILSLAKIAGVVGQPEECERLEKIFGELCHLTDECWDASVFFYHNRDYSSHHSQAGEFLANRYGVGKIQLKHSFIQPVRLLVKINLVGETTRHPEIVLQGLDGETPRSEHLERTDFQWGLGQAVATSRQLFTRLDNVEISGVEKRDQVSVLIMDFSNEDITLFLPLWAGVPNSQRAHALVNQTLSAVNRFGRPYGIPTCISEAATSQSQAGDQVMDSTCQAVHLPWNALIGEGLLTYGLRQEAAHLTTRLMAAVVQNLKNHRAFFRAYHSETGAGQGERNPLHGLAPLGLFLDTLGIEIQSPRRVTLNGKNPFPWPVTVKYRGLTVTRQAEQTVVVFPDGQTLTLNDPTDAVVSAD